MDWLFDYLVRIASYLLKIAVRWFRFRGSGNWLPKTATVSAPPSSNSGVFGCASAEIVYTYRIDGELYNGMHKEPFLMADSLSEYVNRFRQGTDIVVRVKPGQPDLTVVRDEDQLGVALR